MNDKSIARLLAGIADFYRAYPREEAVAGIADHIRAFWDPRMRAALASALASGAEGFDPLCREAAERAIETAPA